MKPAAVSILSVGDEILFGETTDTNAPFIARLLRENGLQVGARLCVGDDEAAIVAAVRMLSATADAVVVTGGLGGTVDDVTARAAAEATGRRLALNDEALTHVRRCAEEWGKPVSPAWEKQALIPAKSVPIHNSTGTACGFRLSHEGKELFFLPGVPSEMEPMFTAGVLPLLSRSDRKFFATATLRVFGMFEPELDELLQTLPVPGLSVAFRVDFPDVEVKLRAEGETEEACRRLLSSGAARARLRLKDFVVGEEGETLDSAVASLFRQKGVTLSLAESCTGGLVAKRITDAAGSSAYFLEGAVTYSNEAKTRALHVPQETLRSRGAVSAETATAMANGIRKASNSDIALSITGVAGPGSSAGKPAGLVFMALADRKGCSVRRFQFAGTREQVRDITASTALDWLRRHLLSLG